MLINLVMVAAGLAALFYGADWLVKGAARLANSFGVPPLVIGLTLVAFGTSMPELLVSVTAALRGSSDVALGNIVGSNVANVGLILGLTGLLVPITVHSQVLRREIPLMLAVSLLALALAWDGTVGREDGVLLAVGIVLFTVGSYVAAQRAKRRPEEQVAVAEIEEYEELEGLLDEAGVRRPLEVGRVVVGVGVLVLGARWLIDGATALAQAAGISELVIGLTLVSVGTSLPELATSLVSAFRHEDDISVGNVVGSNVFNLLAVLGVTALVRPVAVAPSVLRVEMPVMVAFALVLWPLLADGKLARWQGALLFAAYVVFTAYLFLR